MSYELKHRRGTAAQHSVFVGALGEITVKTDTNEIVVHDGVTPGGFTGGGYMPAGTGAVPTTVQAKFRESVSVFDFMTAAQIADVQAGTATIDVTDAIHSAYLALKASSVKTRKLKFPAGFYKVAAVEFSEVVDFTFEFDNAFLVASSSAPQSSVLKILNAFNVSITGSLSIDVANRSNYSSGFYVTAAPGGTIRPDGGLVTRINVDNLIVYNAKTALKICEYNNDAQVAEITFKGFNSHRCPTVVHAGGSQTGVSFIGGNLTSEPNAAFPGAQESAIINEGSFVSTSGTEITLTNTSTGKTVWMTPASSAMYGNPYGITRISGGHIESASTLCVIQNTRFPASQYSKQAQFCVVGSGGYVSPALKNGTFIDVSDAGYEGVVRVLACNFYTGFDAGGLNNRNAYNISCIGDNTQIETDKTSWQYGFLDWMGGVNGGKLLTSVENLVYADNLNNQSVATGATATLVFSSKSTDGQYARNAPNYNATNGSFTVPSAGFKSLRITAYCRAVSGSAVGTIAIYRNGVHTVGGVMSGIYMMVVGEFFDVSGGTVFTIGFTNASGAAVSFGVSGGDSIMISGSN